MNEVDRIVERIDGYHARYTDRRGNTCAVSGTYALGVPLSWYDGQGNYLVICGVNQNRLSPQAVTIGRELQEFFAE